MRLQAAALLFALGLAPAFADEVLCRYCYQDGVEAQGRGDEKSALSFFMRGCEQDDGASCHQASVMLSKGQGAPEDDTQAYSLGVRGCNLDFWLACSDIGIILIRSSNPQAAAKGREELGRACEGGRATGCGNLGVAFRDGLGGPVDASAANPYFERACEGGTVSFCSDFGYALATGAGGIEVDIPRAAALFQAACEGGWQQGCDNAEQLAKQRQKDPAAEKSEAWSTSSENVSFSTGKGAGDDGASQAKTSIGSMKIGQGSETATFTDVRSSCGMFRLTLAFGVAAAPVRQCLGDTDTRHVMLVAEDGRITSSSVDPDDRIGRCVISALASAPIEGLTCSLEASVSR